MERKGEDKASSSSITLVLIAVLSCGCLLLAVWFPLSMLKPYTRSHQTNSMANDPPPPPPHSGDQTPPPRGCPKQHSMKVAAGITSVIPLTQQQRDQCYRTCHLELAESLPENLTLPSLRYPLLSTYESWTRLIQLAQKRITMAAYKSSLRGEHVLSREHSHCAKLGDDVYNELEKAGIQRGIRIEAVENYPPKDPGDNEDVSALSKLGVLKRRRLEMSRIVAASHSGDAGGVMHSKFMIVDDNHFYLGSANFDWRSLNQKMELGVHVENCPCLAKDLKTIFDSYWAVSPVEYNDGVVTTTAEMTAALSDLPVLTSQSDPLTISVAGVDTDVYIAASPKWLGGTRRRWDLDAIIDVIDEAQYQLDIHVMDFVPLYIYQKPRRFWPTIEYAIRRAVLERGVRVRFLTAALHFTSESLSALRSLERSLNANTANAMVMIDVKILNVPAVTLSQRTFARERRTHRKFVVSDDALLIGTSNWTGDYFGNTTGLAIVMKQRAAQFRPLIDRARQVFERDWNSPYAMDLDIYVKQCYDKDSSRDLCKVHK